MAYDRLSRFTRLLAPLFGLPVVEGGETDTRVYRFGRDASAISEAAARVAREISARGWTVREFGGSTGVTPDFAKEGYARRTLWVYDCSGGNGALTWSRDYTWIWRASHEYGHAVTQADTLRHYGRTKRRGAIGSGLTLHDAQAAVYWEALAFHAQRAFLADCGLPQTDGDYKREAVINTLDAVVRCVTGEFSDPATAGVIASDFCETPERATSIAFHLLALADAGALQYPTKGD